MHRPGQQGFTLIEMILTLTILAIVIAAGVPAFGEAMERRRIAGAAEEIKARILLARSEAVKQRRPVAVVFGGESSDNWCIGLQQMAAGANPALADADCDCLDNAPACQVDGRDTLYEWEADERLEMGASTMAATGAGSGFSGFIIDPATGARSDLGTGTIDVLTDSGDYQLRVQVNPLALVSVCTVAGSKTLGGYPQC